MNELLIAALAAGMLVAAFAYASVGHGGASAYIAAMALAGVAPQEMRPIALVLNILVSAIATYKFQRASYFRWRLFWPFAVVSVPLAFVGGADNMGKRPAQQLPVSFLIQLWCDGAHGFHVPLSYSECVRRCKTKTICAL